MDLRTALSNIHDDPLWWRKILIGGALMLTVVGYPWAEGLVVESLDNASKGFPTPLPPWREWTTRYLIGLFAVLIDFVFFVLPVFLVALLFFCVALLSLGIGRDVLLSWISLISVIVLVAYEAAAFASGVAPVGRLIYVEEGRPEDAMSARTLREVLHSGARRVYTRARLRSLPAYLPALLLGLACWLVAHGTFPGTALAASLLLWLALSALLYAHLVVIQLYAAAERAVRYEVDSFVA
jgi:hypothetical protein